MTHKETDLAPESTPLSNCSTRGREARHKAPGSVLRPGKHPGSGQQRLRSAELDSGPTVGTVAGELLVPSQQQPQHHQPSEKVLPAVFLKTGWLLDAGNQFRSIVCFLILFSKSYWCVPLICNIRSDNAHN